MSSMNLDGLCEGLKSGGMYCSHIADLDSIYNIYVAQHGQNSMAGQLKQNIGGLKQSLINLANSKPVSKKTNLNALKCSIETFMGSYPQVLSGGNVKNSDYINASAVMNFLNNVLDV